MRLSFAKECLGGECLSDLGVTESVDGHLNILGAFIVVSTLWHQVWVSTLSILTIA